MKYNRFTAPVLLAGVAILALQPAQAVDVILSGTFLRVGVNDSGGLIDDGFNVGIDYRVTGMGAFPGYDFLTPGSPLEFGSVGYDGASTVYGFAYGNSIGGTTTNTSAGLVLSTSTTGGSFGALAISQNMSFAVNSAFINFAVTLTNTSTSALTDVVYARGLEPDQDIHAGGGFSTTNAIFGTDLVTATAPVTDWTIGIFSNSSITHTPSIRADWSPDPYLLQAGQNDGDGDHAIEMGWNIGTLAAGASVTIDFQYRIAETRDDVVTPPGVPDASPTLILLGLGVVGMVFRSRFGQRR